jgi:hypothetical protein
MDGIESIHNIYQEIYPYNGCNYRKFAEVTGEENPPVVNKTPEWVYELAHISNIPAVLNAIALELPSQVEWTTEPKTIMLKYKDRHNGYNRFVWRYITEAQFFFVDAGAWQKIYLLWLNAIDKNWYVAMCRIWNGRL